jgi:uncharacterized protein YbaR (Trm112 family)
MDFLMVLTCSECGSSLRLVEPGMAAEHGGLVDGFLTCETRHGFPIHAGVPRLAREAQTKVRSLVQAPQDHKRVGVTAERFDRGWSHYGYERTRT